VNAEQSWTRTRDLVPWSLCLLASLVAATVAAVWMVAPGSYPYGSADIIGTGFNHLIERKAGAAIALTAATMGIVLAGTGLVGIRLRGDPGRVALRVAGAGAVAEALCFAFVLGDGAIMALMGYAVALGGPVVAVTIAVLVGRRWPRVGVAMVTAVLVLGLAGLTSGVLASLGDAVGTYVMNLVISGNVYGGRLLWTLGWLIGAACWVWAVVASVRWVRSNERTDESLAASWARLAVVRRCGRVATIVAALCPVPYGLARLTWLTPWPLGGPALEEFVISRELDLPTRLQGFLFAPAVAVGVVLTLGLISRWGEVFPRWIPALTGRAVPVKLAVVPGMFVAAVVTISAPAIMLEPIEKGDLLELAYMLFIFPFPVWGLALGVAVLAYWLRRTHALDASTDTHPAFRIQTPVSRGAPAERPDQESGLQNDSLQ